MIPRMAMVAALLVGCLAFLQCSVAKKDQRALERVQAKRPLVDAMVPVVRDLYPCILDTIAIVIPGGVDSVYYPVPVIDTVYDRRSGYAQGFIDGQLAITKQKYAVHLPDTVLKTIIDRTGVQTMERQISYMNGQLSERDEQLKEFKSAKRERDWTMYGLIALLIITNVGWAVIRFK